MKIQKLSELEKIEKVAKILIQSKNVIVLTGAGISTESGIPDFRGESGLWEKHKPEIYGTIQS